jgi:hypothetical protein
VHTHARLHPHVCITKKNTQKTHTHTDTHTHTHTHTHTNHTHLHTHTHTRACARTHARATRIRSHVHTTHTQTCTHTHVCIRTFAGTTARASPTTRRSGAASSSSLRLGQAWAWGGWQGWQQGAVVGTMRRTPAPALGTGVCQVRWAGVGCVNHCNTPYEDAPMTTYVSVT